MDDQQNFDDLLNETNPSIFDVAMLEAAVKRDDIMLKLRCVELASEYQRARIEHTSVDKHGGDLVRLAAGIYKWVDKSEVTDPK